MALILATSAYGTWTIASKADLGRSTTAGFLKFGAALSCSGNWESRCMDFPATATRPLLYAWAAPTTLVGLTAGAFTALIGRHRSRCVKGALEFHGRFPAGFPGTTNGPTRRP